MRKVLVSFLKKQRIGQEEVASGSTKEILDWTLRKITKRVVKDWNRLPVPGGI